MKNHVGQKCRISACQISFYNFKIKIYKRKIMWVKNAEFHRVKFPFINLKFHLYRVTVFI